VLLAPVVLPMVGQPLRPLAKAALHGYFNLVYELKSLAADDEPTAAPMLGSLVDAGVKEAAATSREAVVGEEVGESVVEGVITILEVV
jgi:hypothetical protein